MTQHVQKSWWRWAKWPLSALGAFVAAVFFYFVAVFVLGNCVVQNPQPPHATAAPKDVLLFIRSNGVHTDLVLPATLDAHDWRALVPAKHFKKPDSSHTYVAFGWGDRGFYLDVPTWNDLTLGAGLRAMSGQGPAAMHITFMPTPVASESVTPFRVSRAEYAAIAAHVKETLVRGADGRVQQIASPWQEDYDALFAAHSAYSPFKTCNEWTRLGLARAGLPTARWAVFPFAVTKHLPQA
jgi:uncharacterized protein (TIGR02117 family)